MSTVTSGNKRPAEENSDVGVKVCARGPPAGYNLDVASKPEKSDSESEESDDSVHRGRPTRWTTDQTIRFIVEELLKAEGRVKIEEIIKATRYTLAHDTVKKVVKKQDIFKFSNSTQRTVTFVAEKLHVCQPYALEECKAGGPKTEPCLYLHVCANFLIGKCPMLDEDCVFGHKLTTQQNKAVITKAGVASLPEDVLFKLVAYCCQKQVVLNRCNFPVFCDGYNGQGCSLSEDICPRFHVCRRYFSPTSSASVCDTLCELKHRITGSQASRGVVRLLSNVNIDMTHYTEKELRIKFRRYAV